MLTRLAAKNVKLAKLGLDYSYPLSASAIATSQKLSVNIAGQKGNYLTVPPPVDGESKLVSFVVDSDEDEISFRTPPNTRRRSTRSKSSSSNDVASADRASSSSAKKSASHSIKAHSARKETRQLSKERAVLGGGSDTKVRGRH